MSADTLGTAGPDAGTVLKSAGNGSAAAASGTPDATDKAAITAVMSAYEAALNGGKTAAILPLYTDNGVFMPPYIQSVIGKDAVKAAYGAVFQELKFDLKFHVAELVVMSPAWAYVRTNSAGTIAHQSTGKTTTEENQELFILRKADDGQWRIARYSFSPTNPPAE